jgi:hypothetical protein
VPEYLRSRPLSEEEKARGDTVHARWDWVLDEMIWAFEQHTRDCWETDYYIGEVDIRFEQLKDQAGYTMVKGPKDTFKVDHEGIKRHEKRMANGLRLFGKYYSTLWS